MILFDEIEKAHPDVFNILLQVLDEGRLTDGKGRTVDFKNTVLIMTSNVASDLIQESATKDIPDLKSRLMDALRRTFRPEFLNRIDEIVTFGALGEDQIRRIVEIQFQDLKKRVAEKKIEINLSPEAATLLAHVGYDPVFGARPLKRAIQRMVENPLALQLLAGNFREGDKLTVDPAKTGIWSSAGTNGSHRRPDRARRTLHAGVIPPAARAATASGSEEAIAAGAEDLQQMLMSRAGRSERSAGDGENRFRPPKLACRGLSRVRPVREIRQGRWP